MLTLSLCLQVSLLAVEGVGDAASPPATARSVQFDITAPSDELTVSVTPVIGRIASPKPTIPLLEFTKLPSVAGAGQSITVFFLFYKNVYVAMNSCRYHIIELDFLAFHFDCFCDRI